MSPIFWEYHFKDQLDRIKIPKKFKYNQCEIKYRRNLIFYWYASISNIIWKFPSSRWLYLVILSENKNVMTIWNEPILPIGKCFFLFLFLRMIWYNFCVHFPLFSFLPFFFLLEERTPSVIQVELELNLLIMLLRLALNSQQYSCL